MGEFREAMRRVITGDNADGQSVIIIDGGPSVFAGDPELGGLFEIWEDGASGPLNPVVALGLSFTPNYTQYGPQFPGRRPPNGFRPKRRWNGAWSTGSMTTRR